MTRGEKVNRVMAIVDTVTKANGISDASEYKWLMLRSAAEGVVDLIDEILKDFLGIKGETNERQRQDSEQTEQSFD